MKAQSFASQFKNELTAVLALDIKDRKEKEKSLLSTALAFCDSFPSEDDRSEARALLQIRKECQKLCCDICRTEVITEKGSGCRSISPLILSDKERSIYVSLYDHLQILIRSADRMHIPDSIERTPPDRDRLLFLMRRYLAVQADTKKTADTRNLDINRLFGSKY